MSHQPAGFKDTQSGSASAGQRLAAAREAQGLSIEDVVRHTKLSPRQIMALEADAYDKLPGPVFVRGFMRNYARHLRLDAAPLLAMLDAKSAPAEIPAGNPVEPAVAQPAAEQAPEPASELAPPAAVDKRDVDQTIDQSRAPLADSIGQKITEPAAPAELSAPPVRTIAGCAPAAVPASEPTITEESAAIASAAVSPMEEAASVSPADKSPMEEAAPAASMEPARAEPANEAGEPLDGMVDAGVAWRNYALISLAVVIGLLLLVILTQS